MSDYRHSDEDMPHGDLYGRETVRKAVSDLATIMQRSQEDKFGEGGPLTLDRDTIERCCGADYARTLWRMVGSKPPAWWSSFDAQLKALRDGEETIDD